MTIQKRSSSIFTACLVLIGLVTALSFTSCNKDDDGPEVNDQIKITIAASETFSKAGGADLSISFGSFEASSRAQKWKINGEDTGTETLHRLTSDDFEGGKSYTIESQREYISATVNLGAFSIDQPFELTYKIEQGGKVIAEEEVEISKDKDVYTKSWSFPQ